MHLYICDSNKPKKENISHLWSWYHLYFTQTIKDLMSIKDQLQTFIRPSICPSFPGIWVAAGAGWVNRPVTLLHSYLLPLLRVPMSFPCLIGYITHNPSRLKNLSVSLFVKHRDVYEDTCTHTQIWSDIVMYRLKKSTIHYGLLTL